MRGDSKKDNMLEKDFEQLAQKTLDAIAEKLDALDASGELELEYQNGIITIKLESGKQFIVNKHAPSKQIWLSSPISGGLHFSYNDGWKLADGRELENTIMSEITELSK